MDMFKFKNKTDVEGEDREKVQTSQKQVSDSDDLSDMSTGSVDGTRRPRSLLSQRKRSLSRDLTDGNSSDGELEPASKASATQRGRGRPPTTGHYVGLAKAKRELIEAEREEMRLRAEQELASASESFHSTRSASRLCTFHDEDEEPVGAKPAAEVFQQILDCVTLITTVATKSKNLKGTSVKDLKVAGSIIRRAGSALLKRTTTDETALLRADNARLQKEMAEHKRLIKELQDKMAGLADRPALPPSEKVETADLVEKVAREVMLHVGPMVSARLEAFSERLPPEKRLRPPLAADKKREKVNEVPAPPSEPGPSPSPARVPVVVLERLEPIPTAVKGKGKGKGKSSQPQTAAPAKPKTAQPSATPADANTEWATVVKRGKGQKKASTGSQSATQQPARSQAQPPSQRRLPQGQTKKALKPKIRPPRSSAVVIAIQPGAAEKGVTYYDVIAEAKAKIDLKDLGILSLGIRGAATGARLIEVPGAGSGDKADSLAAKMREIFAEEDVRISRPVKCAELRISGLDDSVSTDEVAGAVARAGCCHSDNVRTGAVRSDFRGVRTTIVRCPVTAAKKVAKMGRLLIGWVSAKVTLLTPKPMRCFRCLEIGHVREQCTSEVDRGNMCYRCGDLGHKAVNCSAEPHCTICAEAGKPAGHRIGGPACAPPKKKKRGKKTAAVAKAKSQPAPPAASRVVQMDTQQG